MAQTTDADTRHDPETREIFSPCLPRELCLLWIIGLALIAAVSRQSLWIDEAGTAMLAGVDSFREWLRILLARRGAELQQPGFMFYMWTWVKVIGDSEWALRAAGLVWMVPGLVAMASGFSRRTQRMAVMLVAVTSAFAWYYAGEARTYAMQLGASCLIFGALHRLGRDELSERGQSRWLSGFLFGVFMLCASNLLGVIWSIAALAAALILIPRRRLLDLWKTGWPRLVLTGLLLLLLGIYYLWTLSVGARATAIGSTDLKTIIFVFYEQLGLTGLGPGRLDLREGGMGSLRAYILPLAGYAVLCAILIASGIREALRLESAKRVCALALAVALPAVMLLGVGFATHFRVLGRHFAPLMPIWFCLLALGLSALWDRREGWMGRPLLEAYLLLSLCSCLSIRFATRHQRDDYRDAAQTAINALRQHQVVWWSADSGCAQYYKLPLATQADGNNVAIQIYNTPAADLVRLKKPDIVIASKPDIYDAEGTLAEYLARNHYRALGKLPAFTLWGE
ncbi:MAG: hypothetical protein ABSA83_19985 [Verrucomicrobiota bacterium]|jgi:hypothetical protein